jgi:hypothetical protein
MKAKSSQTLERAAPNRAISSVAACLAGSPEAGSVRFRKCSSASASSSCSRVTACAPLGKARRSNILTRSGPETWLTRSITEKRSASSRSICASPGSASSASTRAARSTTCWRTASST